MTEDNATSGVDNASFIVAKNRVNSLLEQFCAVQRERASLQGEHYVRLWISITKLLLSGGKRMRPLLTIQTYEMFGGKDDDIVSVAAALELLHLSVLIHDDIIDRDEVRYGVPNITGQYRQHYKGLSNEIDITHFSNSAALLAGDALLSSSYSLVLDSGLNSDQKVLMTQVIAGSVYDVIGGELLDTEAVQHDVMSVDPLTIAEYKTAGYSFIGPLMSGAMLAETSNENIEHLKQYGLNLGIGFQLADDLLGVFGDEKITGKPNTSDIAEGKPTLLMQRALKLADDTKREELLAVLGKGRITNEQADNVRQIIIDVGAVDEVTKTIKEYVTKAKEALSSVDCDEDKKQPLYVLLIKATERVK